MKMQQKTILLVPVPFLVSGCSPMGGSMMPMMDHGYGGILLWLIGIVLIAAIIYLVVSQSKRGDGREAGSPLDILNKRYARGEITREEFERMKKDIEGSSR